jgi:Icc-related predicted phosphoesterase
MRIVITSDTHGVPLRKVIGYYSGDILIHCGDVTGFGTKKEVEQFLDEAKELHFKHIVFIAGNHDEFLNGDRQAINKWINALGHKNVTYLCDSWIEIEGIKIYGAPWCPIFGNWDFMIDDMERAVKWAKIPDDVDILVTHTPPFGRLDHSTGARTGCTILREVVDRAKPKVHCFGHIHPGYGTTLNESTLFINAAHVTNMLTPKNEPVIITHDGQNFHLER